MESSTPPRDTAWAMSEEGNVKFVLDGYARFNAGERVASTGGIGKGIYR
jgi:hypothetical protein